MQFKLIKTKSQYRLALTRIEEIFQSKDGTPDSDEADVLALLIKSYENQNFIIEKPSPIEAIKDRMEQQGLSYSDLAQILGYKSRVTDIFNNNRKLNLNMIRKLNSKLNIPLETLIREY